MSSTNQGEADQSASPFIVHRVGDRYSLCTSVSVLCHSVSYEAAALLLTEAGADPGILDSPSDPLLFHSTWAAAVSASLEELSVAIDAPLADVAELRESLNTVAAQQAALQTQLDAERQRGAIRAEIGRLGADLESRRWIIKQGLVNPSDAEVEACLQMTPIAQRIRQLREQL